MQKREGSIKGECNQARGLWLLLLLSSRCLDTSIRVFTKPQTCDQQCLPEAILVTAGIKIVVCQQDCRMKVGFGRLACSTSFVKPSGLPVGRGSG